jgi:hypothetical protein
MLRDAGMPFLQLQQTEPSATLFRCLVEGPVEESGSGDKAADFGPIYSVRKDNIYRDEYLISIMR